MAEGVVAIAALGLVPLAGIIIGVRAMWRRWNR